MTDARLKFVSAVLLFGLWAWLVWAGKADPQTLETGIQAALVGMGVFHISKGGQS